MTKLIQLSEGITQVNIDLDYNQTESSSNDVVDEKFDLKLYTSVLY